MDDTDLEESIGWQDFMPGTGLPPSLIRHSTYLTDPMSLTPGDSPKSENDWTNSTPLTFDGASIPVCERFEGSRSSPKGLAAPQPTIDHDPSKLPSDSELTLPSIIDTSNVGLDSPVARLTLSSPVPISQRSHDSSTPPGLLDPSLSPQSPHREVRSLLKLAPSPAVTPTRDLSGSQSITRPTFSRRPPSIMCPDVPHASFISDDIRDLAFYTAEFYFLGEGGVDLDEEMVENSSIRNLQGYQAEASPVEEKEDFSMDVLECVARGEANVFEEQAKRKRAKVVDAREESPYGVEVLEDMRAEEDTTEIKLVDEDYEESDEGDAFAYKLGYRAMTETYEPENKEPSSRLAPSSPSPSFIEVDNTADDHLISSPAKEAPGVIDPTLDHILQQLTVTHATPISLVPTPPPPPPSSPLPPPSPPPIPRIPNSKRQAFQKALFYAEAHALAPNENQTHWTTEIKRLHGEIRQWEEDYDRGRRMWWNAGKGPEVCGDDDDDDEDNEDDDVELEASAPPPLEREHEHERENHDPVLEIGPMLRCDEQLRRWRWALGYLTFDIFALYGSVERGEISPTVFVERVACRLEERLWINRGDDAVVAFRDWRRRWREMGRERLLMKWDGEDEDDELERPMCEVASAVLTRPQEALFARVEDEYRFQRPAMLERQRLWWRHEYDALRGLAERLGLSWRQFGALVDYHQHLILIQPSRPMFSHFSDGDAVTKQPNPPSSEPTNPDPTATAQQQQEWRESFAITTTARSRRDQSQFQSPSHSLSQRLHSRLEQRIQDLAEERAIYSFANR